MRLHQALLLLIVLVIVGLIGSHVLSTGAFMCDRRVQQLTAERDRATREALQQVNDALAQQEASLVALREERGESRALRKRLSRLANEGETAHRGGKSSSHSGAVAPDAHGGGGRRIAAEADGQQPPAPTLSLPPSPPAAVTTAGQRPLSLRCDDASRKLVPSSIAVVVIAYNRPQYLDEALASIFRHHPGGSAFPVYVSQDGDNADVRRVIEKHGARRLVHPRTTLRVKPGTYLAKFPGYAYLSVHYGWALRTLFGMEAGGSGGGGGGASGGGGGPYEGVVILEEDIEVAADFWSYFTATAALLEADPSLLCVSAFNDNGQTRYPGEPSALHRSDFFPGLGWLLTRKLWAELEPKWPEERGFWDDWLREPEQRKGRGCIRPEVSRTRTFGKTGTSVGQFYSKYLATIGLNAAEHAVDFCHGEAADLSYLLRDAYEARFQGWMAAATVVPTLDEAKQRVVAHRGQGGRVGDLRVPYQTKAQLVSMCKVGGGARARWAGERAHGGRGSARTVGGGSARTRQRAPLPLATRHAPRYACPASPRAYPPALPSPPLPRSLLGYLHISTCPSFLPSQSLGLMEDLKAGVPRTAYHGVVMLRINGVRVFLAPSFRVDQDITKPLP